MSEMLDVQDSDLLIFRSIPAVEEVCNFVWDTTLPELDAPWPQHDMNDLDVRGMIAFLTKRPDVTGFLYELDELERYSQQVASPTRLLPLMDDNTFTVMMEAVQ